MEPADLPAGTCGLDIRVDGLLAAHAVPRLCEQLVLLVDCGGVGRLAVDLGQLEEPDLATIDALARLALAARRRSAQVTVRTSNGALEMLLRLAGLSALASPPRSVVEGER
jgi:anti-anti-sigma regulatory factor